MSRKNEICIGEPHLNRTDVKSVPYKYFDESFKFQSSSAVSSDHNEMPPLKELHARLKQIYLS